MLPHRLSDVPIVDERFAAHLAGKGAKYTRLNKPTAMRIVSDDLSKSEALKQEIAIKKLTVGKKRELWDEAVGNASLER